MSRRKGSSRFPEAKTDPREALERIAADPATKLAAALQAAHILRGDSAASPAPRPQPAPTAAPPAIGGFEPASPAPTPGEAEPPAEPPAADVTGPGSAPPEAEPRAMTPDTSDIERQAAPPHDETSTLPRTGMPRRDRIVAPVAEFQTTLLTFARSEAEHALAHASDLMRARTVTEVADLQVSALIRATGASLTCFAALMRSMAGSPRRKGEGS